MPDLLFVDTETTGLDYARHEVVELAWAVEDGPVQSLVVPHIGLTADPEALRINKYFERRLNQAWRWASIGELANAYDEFKGKTLIGANPRFDSRMLERVFGYASPNEPWHYRMFDIQAWAAGVLGQDRPLGMRELFETLQKLGRALPEPDHSAAGDVITLRAAYRILQSIQRTDHVNHVANRVHSGVGSSDT